MKSLSVYIVFSLLLVSIFGFWGFGFMNHNSQADCPAITIFGNVGGCPLTSDAFAVISHHLSSLQHLTQSTIAVGFIILLSLLFVFLRLSGKVLSKKIPISQKRQKNLNSLVRIKKILFYWLALHNKRDPYLLF